MESFCPSQEATLRKLERLAPGAPFLALGQTVFWDEPLKAGVAQISARLGFQRPFVAGVHDTDYFAKLPHRSASRGFRAAPHNDTTTRDLWSAAGEFSALLGSETVVTRELLQRAGARLGRIEHERPGFLDEITEAYGWRGVVSLSPDSRTTSQEKLTELFPVLFQTFDWALRETTESISGTSRPSADRVADELRARVCEVADQVRGGTLADLYERLLPDFFRLVAGEDLPIETQRTTRLLALSRDTAGLPRFELLGLFLNPETRERAAAAYNQAVEGTQIYPLERFGVGALPFDVLLPDGSRGTLRLGTRGGLVMTPSIHGFSYKRAPESVAELADLLEGHFGAGCTIVGKAVALIGMLAREFVFIFHEGASSYVPLSVRFHRNLAAAGLAISLNPVLRVKYSPWDALGDCCAWLRLPEPLRRPFGVDVICGRSFAKRHADVAQEQSKRLEELARFRSPLELVKYLDTILSGSWRQLAKDYQDCHEILLKLERELETVRKERDAIVQELRALKIERAEAEAARGRHWRERIFEKNPSEDDWRERERLTQALEDVLRRQTEAQTRLHGLRRAQRELVQSPEVTQARSRRSDLALETEIMRCTLIREAILATRGLRNAGNRPSAWWFRLVCPDGEWYRATMRGAEYYLEPLQ